jgi:hypothetical protein
VRRLSLILAYSFLPLLLCGGCSTEPQSASGAARFPAARTRQEGHEWLKWTRSNRTAFVAGYVKGKEEGCLDGCSDAEHVAAQATDAAALTSGLLLQCHQACDAFTQPADVYGDAVTSFYEKFPSDQDIPITYVLQLLSDKNRKSSEQIHAHYSSMGRGSIR